MTHLRPTITRIILAASAAAVFGTLSCAARAQHPVMSPPHVHATSHGEHDATVHHPFDNVTHWTAVFDDPSRDAWQKPAEVVQALDLRPGMRVADLGAGTGYFSRYLSAAVGDDGTVFAVDTEPNLVTYLRKRSDKEHTANLVPILASPDNPRLPIRSTDLVLIVDTFHHIDARLKYFARLRRLLKPGGRVAIIDWQKRELPVGPPPPHKIPRAQVVEEMEAAGYQLVAEPALLPYQYFLIFRSS